ncbi:MAG: DUF1048 domain-containing protein [Clostridiales Family XIII bacterium]|jgi:DNA-binding ferritin-like protein (Dps family)|nr:DUF1048 domain-containing protein [Clostridiales Family XIII bacterium]
MLQIIKKLIGDKREYREMMARVDALPSDYQLVFKKIQKYMWGFAAGDGYDMLNVHYGLIELFEAAAANGKRALDVTGADVAAFCDELLQNTQTYTAKWRTDLNRSIMKEIKKHGDE